jgi:type II secretory pathway pseudopilin PulG
MVVVAIVITLAAWGVPALAIQVRDRAMYNAGLQAQQDLRQVQQAAITTRVARSVSFDTTARTYTFTYRGTSRMRTLRQDVVLSLPSWATTTLWFDEFGRPCSKDGSGALQKLPGDVSVVFTNRAGDRQVTVTVGHVLGRSSLVWTIR